MARAPDELALALNAQRKAFNALLALALWDVGRAVRENRRANRSKASEKVSPNW